MREGDHFDYAGFKKELIVEIEKLEDGLMEVELKLQESLQISTNDFQERIKKIIDEMKHKTDQFVTDAGAEISQFSEALKVYALAEFDRVNASEDELNADNDNLSNDYLNLMTEHELLNQHLEQSKENLDAKIQEIESLITKELGKDWEETKNRILENQ